MLKLFFLSLSLSLILFLYIFFVPSSTRFLVLFTALSRFLQLAASRATCHRKPGQAGAEFEITLVYIVLRLRLKYCIKFAGW